MMDNLVFVAFVDYRSYRFGGSPIGHPERDAQGAAPPTRFLPPLPCHHSGERSESRIRFRTSRNDGASRMPIHRGPEDDRFTTESAECTEKD